MTFQYFHDIYKHISMHKLRIYLAVTKERGNRRGLNIYELND